jgi:hypothetical protein
VSDEPHPANSSADVISVPASRRIAAVLSPLRVVLQLRRARLAGRSPLAPSTARRDADHRTKKEADMRRLTHCVAVAVLAVTMASCSDDDDVADTTVTTATTMAVPPAAAMEAMLLTADDIEAQFGGDPGWTVEPIDYEEGLSGYLQLRCDDVVLDPTIVERLTAETGIDAGREDGGATLVEFLITGDAEQLSADLEAWVAADESCTATQSTSPDTTATRELALPELGDQQYAEAGTCEGWGPDSQSYTALVRIGTVAILLGVCEGPVSEGAELLISDEEFVQLLEAAVAKVGS